MPDAEATPLTAADRNLVPGALPITSRHHLLVTTAKGVYAWTNRGSAELFSSHSNGIATAARIHTDKDLLAVADSQVVILHDVEKGRRNTYRLRKEDQGQVRKLFYHPEQKRLYFTTTLQNAVQTFSLETLELLDAAPVHPSPPTVFAVSPACDLLVSASADPPITYLSRIAYKQPPLLFVPTCSNSVVVAIAFHPSRSNVFVLGFQDGTVAAYDATILPASGIEEERFSYSRIRGEIAHITHLHKSMGQDAARSSDIETVKTISAIQFFSDRPCSIVTIGVDGYCCIVNFERDGKKVSEIVNRWQLKAPATSLAVLRSERSSILQVDGPSDESPSKLAMILGIGMSDGTVAVYTREGELLAGRDFTTDGRILDLEWTERKNEKPDTVAVPPALKSPDLPLAGTYPTTPPSLRSSQSGSKIMVKLHVKDKPSDDYLLRKASSAWPIAKQEAKKDTPSLDGQLSPQSRRDIAITVLEAPLIPFASLSAPTISIANPPASTVTAPGPAPAILQVAKPEPSIEKPQNDGVLPNADQKAPSIKTHSRRASNLTTSSRASRRSGKKVAIPVIPPRPTPRPGGQLALRRIESAKTRRQSVARNSPVPKEIVRAVINGEPEFNKVKHPMQPRPKMHRRQTSHVSPFSEPEEPKHRPVTPRKPLPTPTAGILPTSRTPAPVQFDRLLRTSWGADSTTTSMTGSSMSGISAQRPRVVIPAKPTMIVAPMMSPPKPHIMKFDFKQPKDMIYTSDSGTSLSEVLDWTPAQARNLVHPPKDHPPVLDRDPTWGTDVVVKSKPNVTSPRPVRDAETPSSGSQLDWSSAKLPEPAPAASIISTDKGKRREILTSSSSSLPPAQIPQPLSVPKLRTKETAINLKDKKNTVVEETFTNEEIIPVKIKIESTVKAPRLSDPGPVRRVSIATRELETPVGLLKPSEIAPTISRTLTSPGLSPLPALPALHALPALSALPNRSSTASPTTRQSSHFLPALPAFRSGSTLDSQSTYTIEDVIRIECAALATRIDAGFEEQRLWIEGFMRDRDWYALRLEEENRGFREELAKARKG